MLKFYAVMKDNGELPITAECLNAIEVEDSGNVIIHAGAKKVLIRKATQGTKEKVYKVENEALTLPKTVREKMAFQGGDRLQLSFDGMTALEVKKHFLCLPGDDQNLYSVAQGVRLLYHMMQIQEKAAVDGEVELVAFYQAAIEKITKTLKETGETV